MAWQEEMPHSPSTPGRSVLVVLFLVQSAFTMLRTWLFTASGERIVANLRVDLFEAIVGQDIEFFDHRRTGELTNRLSVDTAVLQNTVTVNLARDCAPGWEQWGGSLSFSG